MAISTTKVKYLKAGDTIDITPSDKIACGAIKYLAGCPCIALFDIPANTLGSMKCLHRGEKVEITTDEAIGETLAGVAIYVTGEGIVTKESSGNTLLGFTDAAVSSTALSFTIVCV